MKRFLLFGNAEFYPEGGWDDLLGDFDEQKEAEKFAKQFQRQSTQNWFHCIDLTTGEKVFWK